LRNALNRSLLNSQTVARTVVANFNSVKEAVCLQQSSNSTYCVTDLLTKIQTALGTDLTVSTLTSLDLASLEKIPSSDVCDDCAHALTTKLVPILESASSSSSATTGGSSASGAGSASAAVSTVAASGAAARKAKRQSTSSVSTSDISSAISSYCGSSFLDGQIPSGIQDGSGSSSSDSSSGNNAVSSTSLSGAADLSAGSWSKVAGVVTAAGLAGAVLIA
jgi:hypothetical protein